MSSAARRPAGTARAGAGQVAGGIAVDLVALLVLAGLVVLAAASAQPDLAILAILAFGAFVVAQLRAWSRTGRSLGYLVAGVRQVATADGAPPGLARALSPSWLADVRHGRDPVEPAPFVPLLPPVAPATPPPAFAQRTHLAAADAVAADAVRSAPRVLLIVDGAVSGAIGEGVVLGRNPTSTGNERAVAVADIRREISKAHLGLRSDADGRIWAVDRQSTNGSTLTRGDGAAAQLTPGTEVGIGPGDVIRIGSHAISVQFVDEVRVAAR
jgi:hypothetical protein